MTVSTQTNTVTYPGNGSAVTFPFNFPVFAASHLFVHRWDIATESIEHTYDLSEYSIAGLGSFRGGSVTLNVAPANTKKIIIIRVLPLTQDLDINNEDGFYPDVLERELDIEEMQIQQLKENLGRALQVQVGETLAPLPRKASRANKFMGFDPAGNFILDLLTVNTIDDGAFSVSSRTLLAAIAATNGQVMFLAEDGREGWFIFHNDSFVDAVAADNLEGIYVAPSSDASGASGAWVRVWDRITLYVNWFGAVIDNATDDHAAIAAAIALSYFLRIIPTAITSPGYGPGGGPDVCIPGLAYMGGNTLTLTHSFNLIGNNVGVAVGPYAGMRWDGTCTGIVNSGRAGIYGLVLIGGFSGTEHEYHGIQATFNFSYGNLGLFDWPGDGLNLDSNLGNVNGCVGANVFVQNCRNGYWNKSGGDNSAGNHQGWNIAGCREWGIKEESFLGVSHYTHEVADCSRTVYNDGVNIGCSIVSYMGKRYFAISGQEGWCSIHPPTGTAIDNQGWAYKEDGGVGPSFGIIAWFNGILVRAGGSYFTNNLNAANVFLGCYAEDGQGSAQLSSPTLVLGGFVAVANIWKNSSCGLFTVDNTSIIANKGIKVKGYRGNDEEFSVEFGERDATTKTILKVAGDDTFPFAWRLRVFNEDIRADYAASDVLVSFYITGPNTVLQLGSGAAQPNCFVAVNFALSDGETIGSARRMINSDAAPTTGAHGHGEICWNRDPTVGQPIGWMCTVTGTPGTWVAMANL